MTVVRHAGAIFTIAIGLSVAAGKAHAQDWIIGSSEAAEEPASARPQAFSFSIRPQPLATALSAFTGATGIQVIYDTPIAANRRSAGVQGKFGALQALEQLIDGSDLAPRPLYSGAYTLIPIIHGAAYGAAAPINAPTLKMDVVHIEEPPDHDHRLYAMSVGLAIQSALQHNKYVHDSQYQTQIIVWLSPRGAVRQSSLVASTGNPALDSAITKTVQNVSVGSSPPSGLPQPVFVRVETDTDR